VCIPTIESKRPNSRAVRPGEEFCRRPRSFGKISPQPGYIAKLIRPAGILWGLVNTAGTGDRGNSDTLLEHPGEGRIGVPRSRKVVSSVTDGTCDASHDSTGAGPRMINGVTGPIASSSRPCGSVFGRRQGDHSAGEPAGIQHSGLGSADLQDPLSVKV